MDKAYNKPLTCPPETSPVSVLHSGLVYDDVAQLREEACQGSEAAA